MDVNLEIQDKLKLVEGSMATFYYPMNRITPTIEMATIMKVQWVPEANMYMGMFSVTFRVPQESIAEIDMDVRIIKEVNRPAEIRAVGTGTEMTVVTDNWESIDYYRKVIDENLEWEYFEDARDYFEKY